MSGRVGSFVLITQSVKELPAPKLQSAKGNSRLSHGRVIMYGISNMFLQLTYDRISEFGNIENDNLALARARGR